MTDGKTTVPATIQKEGLFVNIKSLAGLTGGKVAVKKDSATLTVNGISYTFTAGSNRYSAKGSTVILTKSPYIDGGFYIPTNVILKIMKMPLTWSSDGTVITGKIGF
nr:stalk domain-containing protein [uncultured Treponema sp.]